MEKPKFVIANNGNIHIGVAGDSYHIGVEHENYVQIHEAVLDEQWTEILPLLPELPQQMKTHISVYLDAFDLGGAL